MSTSSEAEQAHNQEVKRNALNYTVEYKSTSDLIMLLVGHKAGYFVGESPAQRRVQEEKEALFQAAKLELNRRVPNRV